jgi:hypothetical protein
LNGTNITVNYLHNTIYYHHVANEEYTSLSCAISSASALKVKGGEGGLTVETHVKWKLWTDALRKDVRFSEKMERLEVWLDNGNLAL